MTITKYHRARGFQVHDRVRCRLDRELQGEIYDIKYDCDPVVIYVTLDNDVKVHPYVQMGSHNITFLPWQLELEYA